MKRSDAELMQYLRPPALPRAVRENMSKMAISVRGPNLGARHAMTGVGVFDNIVNIDGLW